MSFTFLKLKFNLFLELLWGIFCKRFERIQNGSVAGASANISIQEVFDNFFLGISICSCL